MTYPGSGGPWAPQPDPNQPQGWGGGPQPGYPQQQPGYPQGFPPPRQQQPGFPQTGPQQFPNQPYQGGFGAIPPHPAQPKSRKGLVIGLVIALVVLAGGGVGTWIALANSSSDTGSASPHDAAMKLMNDLGRGDLLGVANDLPPAESAVLRDTITDTVNQAKRLQIVKQSVDPSKAWSADISTSGITFDDAKAETINDHLTITKLVAGTITVKSDVIGNDFTDQFIHAAFPDGDVPQGGETQTINIGSEVQASGEPIRIATVKANGSWYPSLFYSIADSVLRANGQTWPSQPIPNQGEQTPDLVAEEFVHSLVESDFTEAIKLTAPEETAVLHDAGQAIVNAARGARSGAKFEDVTFADKQVAGGTEAVLQSLRLQVDGHELSIKKDGDCYEATGPDGRQRVCAGQFSNLMAGDEGGDLPGGVKALFSHMSTGLMSDGLGIVTVHEDGHWYVSPLRTLTTVLTDTLGSLQPSDIENLIKLGDN